MHIPENSEHASAVSFHQNQLNPEILRCEGEDDEDLQETTFVHETFRAV